MEKKCSKCGEVKLVSLFRKDRNQCKACVSAYNKEYNEVNNDKIKEYKKEYRETNRDKIKEYQKVYYNEEYKKEYYETNKDKRKEYQKEYRKSNRARLTEQAIVYDKNRRNCDPLYRLRRNIRARIHNSITRMGYTKSSKTYEILGCSYEEFKVYIESQFVEGMSWDNRSEWHLDHKIPVSYGMDEMEIIALNHYSNFQPLWAVDNLSKGNRYMH
jgi:hypothetical protein